MYETLVQGMKGLGDNIYQRAFMRRMPHAYIETPWPELYSDLGIRCVRVQTKLRTQAENVDRTQYEWHRPPVRARVLKVGYGHQDLINGGIIHAMQRGFRVAPGEFDLPDFPKLDMPRGRIAVIRPVTVRTEWFNDARNPDPAYVSQAAEILASRGFTVVSVAHLADGAEWLVGEAPDADFEFHHGELGVSQLLALVRQASVVVGGVGWVVPACVATKTPLYVIQGGHGAHNRKEAITHPSMDTSRIGWATPDRYCRCHEMRHACDKTISNFPDKFARWLDERLHL